MKTLPANLATHVASRATTLATALKITRTDATVFGFTTHDVDDIVSGVTYSANPGLDVTEHHLLRLRPRCGHLHEGDTGTR